MSVQSATSLDFSTIFSQHDNNKLILNTLNKYAAQIFDPSIATPAKIDAHQKEFTALPEDQQVSEKLVQNLFSRIHAQTLEINSQGISANNLQRNALSTLFKENAAKIWGNSNELSADLKVIARNTALLMLCSSVFVSVVNNSPFNQNIFLSRLEKSKPELVAAVAQYKERIFNQGLATREGLTALSGESKVVDSKVADYNQLIDDTFYAMHQIVRRATEEKRLITGEETQAIAQLFQELKLNSEKRTQVIALQASVATKSAELTAFYDEVATRAAEIEKNNKTLETARQEATDETAKQSLYSTISELNARFEEFRSGKKLEIEAKEAEIAEATTHLVALKEVVGESVTSIPQETLEAVAIFADNVPALARASVGFQSYLNTTVAYQESKGWFSWLW